MAASAHHESLALTGPKEGTQLPKSLAWMRLAEDLFRRTPLATWLVGWSKSVTGTHKSLFQTVIGGSCCRGIRSTQVGLLAVLFAAMIGASSAQAQSRAESRLGTQRDPLWDKFDGERAYRDLVRTCEFGPRPSGSEAMENQRQWLIEQYTESGLEIFEQRFDHQHAAFEEPVPMVNLMARYRPDLAERIFIAAHYDTRPRPDQDKENPEGVFVGANDGASGVAMMTELARCLKDSDLEIGIDLILFDGEELVLDRRRDPLFVGSTYFAERYAQSPDRGWSYRCGILLDMVGDANLELYYERNSLKFAPELVRDIWRSADQLRIREFLPRPRHEIRDDHLPMNEIAQVPTVDLIDFDYPRVGARDSYWHTTQDTPDKCSAASLEKVGRVLLHWLSRQ